jgi:hypothetical protein
MTRNAFCCALAGALILSSRVFAAETMPASIEACSRLSHDSERLACYDKAVNLAKAGGEGATAPSAENMFGANGDIAESRDKAPEVKREELKQISGTVTSLRRSDDGMIHLTLDNGQIWRQQDADVRLMVAEGDQVTIARASMGTFRITDKTGRFARFKRVH